MTELLFYVRVVLDYAPLVYLLLVSADAVLTGEGESFWIGCLGVCLALIFLGLMAGLRHHDQIREEPLNRTSTSLYTRTSSTLFNQQENI